MTTGPNGEKRPVSVIANAVRIARIATGEIEETYEAPERKPRRVSVTLKTTKAKKPAGGRAASPTSMVAEGQ